MRMTLLLLGVALAGCSRATPPLPAAADAPIQPSQLRAITCHFTQTSSTQVTPAIKREKAGEPMDWTFSSLDPAANKATAIGNLGAVDVAYWLDGGMVPQAVFLETSVGGNRMMTTVYINKSLRGMSAIHSRHFSIGTGEAVASQYAGACDGKW